MRLKKCIRFFPYCIIPILHSCFLIKVPVTVKHVPIRDTVEVYHFIVSSSNVAVDTTYANASVRESKRAYDWISGEAKAHGQHVVFREHWLLNKDTALKTTFKHRLPVNSLKVLVRKKKFWVLVRKRTKTQERKVEKLSWTQNLYDTLAKEVADTNIARKLLNYDTHVASKANQNELFVFHLKKARRSYVNGFYSNQTAFIGRNKSRTIAHESLHYLGASDLYIHKFWWGKRRRIAKRNLKDEIMNSTYAKNENCVNSYLSNYTAYCMAWDQTIKNEYKPILKENLMAKFIFYVTLLL